MAKGSGQEAGRLAFHPPCTLQHGQKLGGAVEALLDNWLPVTGGQRVAFAESHLCCGSAGTYSVLQPELSGQLRERKLGQIAEGQPDLILSANIGCITHLQAGTALPVRHWVEWLDGALA
jgi:glycolate oxidase iron-sulfur subunit